MICFFFYLWCSFDHLYIHLHNDCNYDKMNLNKILTTVLFAVLATTLKAQPTLADLPRLVADTTYTPFRHQLRLEAQPAFIFQTHEFFRGYNEKNVRIAKSLAGQVKYAFQLPENSQAAAVYRDSYQGIGVGCFSFFEPKSLGTPFAVYAFQGGPMARLSDRLTFDYEWNFGASFGWKPYDATTNRFNHVVGTNINAYINAAFNLNWQLTPQLHLLTGVGFTHFSNGNTGIPNCGVNTVALNMGLAYRFNASDDKQETTATPEFTRHLSYDLTLYGAYRRKGVFDGAGNPVLSPDRYPVGGISFSPMYNFHYRFRAGLSLDGVFDSSAGVYTDSDIICDMSGNCSDYGFYKPSPSRQWALGTSVRAEYVMPFFAINAGIGYNFLAGTDDQRGLYQTLTLKVAVSRLVYLNIGYSLQRFKDPNHLMLGIGFRFHDKSPRLR